MRRVAVLVIALALLTACGGSSGGSAPAATKARAATTPAGPSVQQVASAVAQEKASVDKLRDDLAKCPGDTELSRDACAFVVARAPLIGQIGVKHLSALSSVPAEVQTLMTQTVAAFAELGKTPTKHCDKDPQNIFCDADMLNAQHAVDQLEQQLAGWTPYGA